MMRVGVRSLTNIEYLPLAIDKASKFPFAFPHPLKQAKRVARELLHLCRTLEFPNVMRCDGGGKQFGAIVIQYVCHWLKVDIQLGPAGHPRTKRPYGKN